MELIDLEYDGIRLSSFNSMVCEIGNSSGVETVSIGNTLTLNTVKNCATNKFRLSSTQYDEPYTEVFQIAKYDCSNKDNHVYSETEVAKIVRWLNQKEYKKFKKIYRDCEYSDMYYLGTFNLQKIKLGDEIIGLEMSFTANSFSAFYEFEPLEVTLNTNEEFVIEDLSDELGYLYPSIEIECLEDGNLTISNSKMDADCVIKNCRKNEKIVINGEIKHLESSHHDKLWNDFNFIYPKVINDLDSNENIYKFSLACKIKFSYYPVCKAVI